MIIYVASYPRSGNSWILQLLQNRFRYLMTDIHGDPDAAGGWFDGYKRLSESEGFAFLDTPRCEYEELFLSYRSTDPPGSPKLCLRGGCQSKLDDEDFRQHLAKHENCFILKTHLPPYKRYFNGEWVVQPTRHPGASLWSYYHFLNDVARQDVSLETVIAGDVGYGCWSEHHGAWDRAIDGLGDRLLRVKYEDLFDNEQGFCNRLSMLTGLTVRSEKHVPFSELHMLFPKLARCGRPDDWKRHFNREQHELLDARHGAQMRRMGYT